MSEVKAGYKRVLMVRHEYVSESWASVYHGRLLAGNVYDIPDKDANGNVIADRWLGMGIARESKASMTTREIQLEQSGGVDLYAASNSALRRGVQPDAPVQRGLSPDEIAHPDQFPEGGLRELSPEQADQMSGMRDMQQVYYPPQGQQPAANVPGAFSERELESGGEPGAGPKPVWNRNQLKALSDAGYNTPEDMDAASDEDLQKVDGVGESSVKNFRAMREEQKAKEAARSGNPGPIES